MSHNNFNKILLLFILIFSVFSVRAEAANEENFRAAFQSAYNQYPNVPKGVLEAVAFNNTRFRNIQPDSETESCMGLPGYYGVMGLVAGGKGYFRENLKLIAGINNLDISDLKQNPAMQIQAYAAAWDEMQKQLPVEWTNTQRIVHLFEFFSEIPIDTNLGNDFALNSQLYVYFLFLNDTKRQAEFDFPNYNFDLKNIFGAENYKVLSAKGVQINNHSIQSNSGQQYSRKRMSSDYPPAIWNPTSCNYNSRAGVAISAVTVHTVQGSYAGAISWFHNCNAQVSAHYVIRSVDGQVTQVVAEADRAWHVGTENSYTIGLEHEGFVNDSSWYTAAMYNSSANLVKDIIDRGGYGINPHSTYRGTAQTVINSCYRIKGHIHFPNQTHTDPGVYWDWNFYHYLINNPLAPSVVYSDCNGMLSDSTGTGSNYGDLERYLKIIDPGSNGPLTLSFSDFDLEDGYDFLFVYDGDNINAPLLASLTGDQIPADITANSGKMALLFESDCLYNGRGWEASWACTGCSGNIVIQMDSLKKANCANPTSGGMLSVSVHGGEAPYSYEWSNGSQDSVISGLEAGLYHLTVQDSLGCFSMVSYILASDSVLSFDRYLQDSDCYGANEGEVAYDITEGKAPYTYSWSNGANGFWQKDLEPGDYVVTISDARNCVQIDTFNIQEPEAPLKIDSIESDFGVSYYQLSPEGLSGGTPPYSYLWSTGEQSNTIVVNESGYYSLQITDANGCQLNAFKIVDFPTSIADFHAADLKIFPIPFQQQLNIQVNNSKGLSIAIHNTLGQVVYQRENDINQLEISTVHWPAGVYFVHLIKAEGSVVLSRKVLKY
ncbi:MAG: N-acetylmuramoyl-L-alanine amidase [Chitinophagales bacterium]